MVHLLQMLRLHLFDEKYSKNSNILKYYYNLKELFSIWIYFKIVFIPVIKAASSSSLHVTWSSEIIIICWFAAQETFLIIINAKIFLASYFCVV